MGSQVAVSGATDPVAGCVEHHVKVPTQNQEAASGERRAEERDAGVEDGLVLAEGAAGVQPRGRALRGCSGPAVQVKEGQVLAAFALDFEVNAAAVWEECAAEVPGRPVPSGEDGASPGGCGGGRVLEDPPGPAEVFKEASLGNRDSGVLEEDEVRVGDGGSMQDGLQDCGEPWGRKGHHVAAGVEGHDANVVLGGRESARVVGEGGQR